MLVRITTSVNGKVVNRQMVPLSIEKARNSVLAHGFKRVSEFRFVRENREVFVVPNHLPAETDNWRRLWGKDENKAEYALK